MTRAALHATLVAVGVAGIVSAESGDFHASTGVELATCEARGEEYAVRVRPHGDSRYRIRFVGPGGKVLQEAVGPDAAQRLPGLRGYVRATVLESNGATAWCQPVFLTAR